ncbi:helix-turn-helix domain-containing protein [Microbulbifer sp. CNSA002]|uniref:helix-turn-helix domain-containing protein n=1 Tax=Microbulbifer sp. CNSA002 TaxID=3373604 RepID=UPI0039B668DC
MPDSSPIAKRLFEARTLMGISQRKLGIELGMEPGSASSRMNHYEKGRHSPDYKTLRQISEVLDVPVAFFFCESDITAELVCVIDKLGDEQRIELINEFRPIK